MANPTITVATPVANATGVILGASIVVTFSGLMDHTTINSGSFGVIGPGDTAIITPEQESLKTPVPVTARKPVQGIFTFDDTGGATVVTFTPNHYLIPNTEYKVFIVGLGSTVTRPVKDLAGNLLDKSYGWTFTTGILNLSIPPVQNPTLTQSTSLDATTIAVIPRSTGVGVDLRQEIDLIFPDDLDPTSFDPNDLILSIEPILGDPSVNVPTDLVTSVVVQGNKIKITITGWPADE